jgi:hypothetical protein
LAGVTGITFGGVAATSFLVLSDEMVEAIAPAGTGTVTIDVTDGTATASAYYSYVAPPTPTIGRISPVSGPAAGGTTVLIEGTGFSTATAVEFGGVAAASFTVIGDTQISAVSPAGSGAVLLTVTTPAGVAAAPFAYVNDPFIAKLTPNEGPVFGFTRVQITGSFFQPGAQVRFGTTPATAVEVMGPGLIMCRSPAASGPGDEQVRVVNPDGQTSNGKKFTYLP